MVQFVPWIIAAAALVVAALALLRGNSGEVARLLDREADERARDAHYQRAHLDEVERFLSGPMDALRLETSVKLGALEHPFGQAQAEGLLLLSDALRAMAQH